MRSLWRSGIQNTQDVAGATGWYHGNLPSGETLPSIEAIEEEERAKRRNEQEIEKILKEHEKR
jgi:hypothetical protein